MPYLYPFPLCNSTSWWAQSAKVAAEELIDPQPSLLQEIHWCCMEKWCWLYAFSHVFTWTNLQPNNDWQIMKKVVYSEDVMLGRALVSPTQMRLHSAHACMFACSLTSNFKCANINILITYFTCTCTSSSNLKLSPYHLPHLLYNFLISYTSHILIPFCINNLLHDHDSSKFNDVYDWSSLNCTPRCSQNPECCFTLAKKLLQYSAT